MFLFRFNMLSEVYIRHKTMLSYCVECRKNTENKNPKVMRMYIAWECKISKFIKEQEDSGLLSSLRITTPLNKILL